MRPRACFGVALKAERRTVGARKALQRAIEQRHVSNAHIRRQGCTIDREAVILAGDHHAPSVEILHRMVGAVMAEFHLDGARTARKPEQLVAEADAENRYAGSEQFADRADRVIARLGIAGTVRQENPVWLVRERVFGGALRGKHRELAAARRKFAQDIALDAVIERDDIEFWLVLAAITLAERPRRFIPAIRLVTTHHLREVHAGKAGEPARRFERCCFVMCRQPSAGDKATVLRALLAQDTL